MELLTQGVEVSNYGFLVFETRETFVEFQSIALSSSHAELKAYFSSIGFTSPGATMYGQEYNDSLVTEEQFRHYTLDEYEMVQVENIIMKGVVDSVVLAMRDDYLNNSTYDYLTAGYYDENSMNLFADNVEEEGDWGIIDFTKEDPIGYNHPPESENLTMFGRRYNSLRDQNCCYNNTVYRFQYL